MSIRSGLGLGECGGFCSWRSAREGDQWAVLVRPKSSAGVVRKLGRKWALEAWMLRRSGASGPALCDGAGAKGPEPVWPNSATAPRGPLPPTSSHNSAPEAPASPDPSLERPFRAQTPQHPRCGLSAGGPALREAPLRAKPPGASQVMGLLRFGAREVVEGVARCRSVGG